MAGLSSRLAVDVADATGQRFRRWRHTGFAGEAPRLITRSSSMIRGEERLLIGWLAMRRTISGDATAHWRGRCVITNIHDFKAAYCWRFHAAIGAA